MRNTVLLLSTVLFVTCSSSKPDFVTVAANKVDISHTTLAITLPRRQSTVLTYPRNFDGAISKELYLSLLQANLPTAFDEKSGFQHVGFMRRYHARQMRLQPLRLADGSVLHFKLPVAPLPTDSLHADLILFFENLHVAIEPDDNALLSNRADFSISGQPALDAEHVASKAHQNERFFLKQQADYVFFDNVQNKIVAYGKVETTTEIVDNVIEFAMLAATDDLADSILAQTQFRK